MLFQKNVLQGIKNGEITLAFRKWKKPAVLENSFHKTSIGILHIEKVTSVSESGITDVDARLAGFPSRKHLLESLANVDGTEVFRIHLRYSGEDPRIALREQKEFSDDDLIFLLRKINKYDQASPYGAWVQRLMLALQKYPETRSGELATILKVEKEWLKIQVRKLKNLGLTESLREGYRLSRRGHELLMKINPSC